MEVCKNFAEVRLQLISPLGGDSSWKRSTKASRKDTRKNSEAGRIASLVAPRRQKLCQTNELPLLERPEAEVGEAEYRTVDDAVERATVADVAGP
jgi:hypothetical protein